jgi:hypothetical protein
MKKVRSTGRKRKPQVIQKPFYKLLIEQLRKTNQGDVEFEIHDKPEEGGWVQLKIKSKILSFSLDEKMDLENIGLFQEIREVVGQKKLFGK